MPITLQDHEHEPGSVVALDGSVLGLNVDVRTRRKVVRQAAFLRAYAEVGVIGAACRIAGISRGILDYWRRDDPLFVEQEAEAFDDAADAVEQEVRRRGVLGYQEPVIFQGMPSMVVDPETGKETFLTVTRYSDACILALIRSLKPERFRDNSKVTHETGANTGVLVVPGAVDPALWAEAAKKQQAQWAGNTGVVRDVTIDGEVIPAGEVDPGDPLA